MNDLLTSASELIPLLRAIYPERRVSLEEVSTAHARTDGHLTADSLRIRVESQTPLARFWRLEIARSAKDAAHPPLDHFARIEALRNALGSDLFRTRWWVESHRRENAPLVMSILLGEWLTAQLPPLFAKGVVALGDPFPSVLAAGTTTFPLSDPLLSQLSPKARFALEDSEGIVYLGGRVASPAGLQIERALSRSFTALAQLWLLTPAWESPLPERVLRQRDVEKNTAVRRAVDGSLNAHAWREPWETIRLEWSHEPRIFSDFLGIPEANPLLLALPDGSVSEVIICTESTSQSADGIRLTITATMRRAKSLLVYTGGNSICE